MKLFARIFLLVLVLHTLHVHSQERPFKTGLVLSGGGAKGLSHIGLLQLIDSLEIQIDYITGTSMGSIVGAMYSVGYSGDSIQKSVSTIDWKYLLSNEVPLRRIHINEKDENRNMFVSLPIQNMRPRLPKFVIEGQYLSEVLSDYFFCARNISDFHQLPIPFQCVAADIISGESVILKSGSLARAVRASMAIPAVFSPVHIDDYVLYDGGLTRNFPVEEVKNMGADVVIGSYTGFRKLSQDEISSVTTTIMQSFALSALKDAEKQMELTDILLDLTDDLKDQNIQSFGDYEKFIAIGKREALKLLPQLLELKKKQQAAGIEYKRKQLPEQQVDIKKITVSDIYGEPFPIVKQQDVLSVIGTDDKNQLDTLRVLKRKVNELFSHQFYNKVEYAFVPNSEGGKNLNLFLRPSEPSLQIALHYDTHEYAGIIFRYKQNNFWSNNSRLSVDIDLAQYSKINLSYLKYLNPSLNVWMKAEFNSNKQRYNDLKFKAISELEHFSVTSVDNMTARLKLLGGYSPSPSSSITASMEYSMDRLEKNSGKLVAFFNTEDSVSASRLYLQSYLGAALAFNQNTLNTDLFPTSGNRLKLKVGLFINDLFSLSRPMPGDEIGEKYRELLDPKTYDDQNYNASVLQFSASEFFAVPVSKKLSFQGQLFYGLNFRKKDQKLALVDESDYLFLANKFYLGGYNNYRYDGQIPFAGFQIKEFSANNLASVSLSLQWNAWKKLYITPSVSAATVMNSINPFQTDNGNFSVAGIGIDFDYLTLIGPVKFSYSLNSYDISHTFLSFGYQF